MSQSNTQPSSPLGFLDLAQVIEAVEEYVASRRPDLAARVNTHGIKMSDNGQLVWTLHGDRFHGLTVTERVTVRERAVDPTAA